MTRKPFDLLQEYARFGDEQSLSLRDPAAKAAFRAHVEDAVERAVADSALLRGQRAEAMFEAMVVALGRYQLIKPEDGPRLQARGSFRMPDFRIVLEDGANWLVEVKHVYGAQASRQRARLTRRYLDELEGYAAITGAQLKLAIYWAKWSIWTVVTPSRFRRVDGEMSIDMFTAMKANELGQLGDQMIGTRPPLKLMLEADPERTGPIDGDGRVKIVFRRATLSCDGQDIVDADELQIAWLLMRYGQWPVDGPLAEAAGTRLDAIEFIAAPEETTDQGFEMVGSLSRMFTRYFAEHTLDEADVIRLRAPARPDFFEAFKRVRSPGDRLPLWRFTQQPNFDQPVAECSPAASPSEAKTATAISKAPDA